MTFKLKAVSLQLAIGHLSKYGDTDVFPHLPEISFYRERVSSLVTELEKLDLDTFNPEGAIEALYPKSRFGFRIVHQLPALETVLLLAAVIEIAQKIEGSRLPPSGIEAFSYRLQLTGKGGSIFRSDRTYKDWLAAQLQSLKSNLKIKHIVSSDISDFYARINFHRLENLLDEVAPGHGAARYIKKHIKVIRAKQSFGLPVGGVAARILAELALTDTDKMLQDHGLTATRFVDDFRIFLTGTQDPYDALALLAEHLGISEGLSLNAAKTFSLTRKNAVNWLEGQTSDASDEAEGAALDTLTSDLYFDNEPDPEELEKLTSLNLLGFLQDEVSKEPYDVGRIKVIFRALKITKPFEAIEFLTANFQELVVFAKEMVLLMQALEDEYPGSFQLMSATVIAALLSPPASSIQLLRTWLLELFVRGVVPITIAELKQLDGLTFALDRRQMHLIRGRVGDKNYFRKNKTGFAQYASFEQACFLWGASCLPKDEYVAWLANIKPLYARPAGALYVKWLEDEKPQLTKKLASVPEELPDN